MRPEKTKTTSVRTKLWLSFTLTAVVILAVNWASLKCLTSINLYDTTSAYAIAADQQAGWATGNAVTPFKRVTSTTLISSAAMILILLATGTYVNRILLRPLERTTAAARVIASGNLNELVPIRTQDEIGELGEQINDIAMNTQEILLYMWNSSTRLGNDLNIAAEEVDSEEKDTSSSAGDCIAAARVTLDEIRGTIESFGFYGVELENDKVMGSQNGN